MIEPKPLASKSPSPDLPALKWFERLNLVNVTFIIFILAVVFSSTVIRGSGRDLNYLANLYQFVSNFFPPDLTVMGDSLSSLVETVKIAVMATLFAIVISFFLSLGASQNLASRPLVLVFRMLLNLVRTLPSLVWALIAVAIVGPNPLAGVIGLTFYSIGYLGKFFSEAFESCDVEVARSLRIMGANPFQAFQYGLWPQAKPLIWSYSIWMLEYNIRSASIIGYVGAGGIGTQLQIYQEFGQWDKFATVLICILVVVTLLDLLGERIRHSVTKKIGFSPSRD